MKNLLYIILFGFSTNILAQEVVELPMESTKVIVKLAFKNGSITDPKGKEGLTNLTASLLSQSGSATYTKSEIDNLLYPMAAYYGTFTDKEMTTITFQVHKDFANEFYEVFRGVLLHPSFAQEDFDRVKSNLLINVTEVIKASSDEEFSKMALEEQLFAVTPYAHMKVGTAEGLKAITRDDVVNHYKNYFAKNNVTIGIAGSYSNEFLNRIKTDIGTLPEKANEIKPVPTPKLPDGIQVQLVPKSNNLGTAIYTGYSLPLNRASKDWAAMVVVNSYLGEHRKSYSRLYQLIREQRSMNYGDYTYIEWYQSGGRNQLPLTGFPRSQNYFAIWIRPVQTAYSLKSQYEELADIETGQAQFALRMALYEINRVKEEGLSEDEFELTRQFLRSYSKLYIQTPERQLGFLLDSKFYGIDDYIAELDEALSKLTLEEVNAAAANYLQTENMFVTMITDSGEVEALQESLLSNKPSPMSYANSIRESLTEEIFEKDKQIENLKINIKGVVITPPEELFIK